MVSQQQSLRDRQVGRPAIFQTVCSKAHTDCSNSIASIEKILNFNQVAEDAASHHNSSTTNGLIPQTTPLLNADGDPIWKVLVFDDLGRDVISSVLRVNDLRGWGVTIHL